MPAVIDTRATRTRDRCSRCSADMAAPAGVQVISRSLRTTPAARHSRGPPERERPLAGTRDALGRRAAAAAGPAAASEAPERAGSGPASPGPRPREAPRALAAGWWVDGRGCRARRRAGGRGPPGALDPWGPRQARG